MPLWLPLRVSGTGAEKLHTFAAQRPTERPWLLHVIRWSVLPKNVIDQFTNPSSSHIKPPNPYHRHSHEKEQVIDPNRRAERDRKEKACGTNWKHDGGEGEQVP